MAEALQLNVSGWDNYELETIKEKSNISIFFLGFLGGLIALIDPLCFSYDSLNGFIFY